MNPVIAIVIVLAGLASALAIGAAQGVGGTGALPLFLLAPLPVYFAGLAYGTTAAVGASVATIFLTAMIASPALAVGTGLIISIPASLIAHQANLAQPDADGTLEWYPLPRMILNLSLAIAIAILVSGYLAGFDREAFVPQTVEFMREIQAGNPAALPIPPDGEEAQARRLLSIAIFLLPGIWVIVHTLNAWAASALARSAKLLPRPRDDIPASAAMPAAGLGVTFASFLAMLLLPDGSLRIVATIFAGTFGVALSLIGLAALHYKARSMAAGSLLLAGIYLFLILAYPFLLIFSVGGVLRSFANLQRPIPPGGGSGTSNST